MHRSAQSQVRCPAVQQTLAFTFPPMVALTAPPAYPVERRHPYTDRRLVELLLSMPQNLKWEHHKRFFLQAYRLHHRKAMKDILPNEVRIDNVGVDFSPVIKRNFQPNLMQNWLKNSSLIHTAERNYVYAESLIDALNNLETSHHHQLTILCIENWLRELNEWRKNITI